MVIPSKASAKERLQRARDGIPDLQQLPYGSPSFEKWHRDTKVAIAYTFGNPSSQAQEFEAVKFSLRFYISGMPDSESQKAYVRGLESAAAILESMIEEVEEYWESDNPERGPSEAPEIPERINTNQAFSIHGRDHGTRDTVTRFIESLGIKAVILQEQPDQGRTVIEKFEECAQGDFAIALFTPDDVGGLDDDALQPRARQNVVFEFGYFIGKFGRDRVLALVKGNPEIPSDYSGVIYIRLDESGGWKMELIKEMKSAGFDIDANRAFE